jgi:hypothetical protein
MTHKSEDVLVGRLTDGTKLYVQARFDLPADGKDGVWREAVDHTRTTERLRLSVVGTLVAWNGSLDRNGTWIGVGQTTESLMALSELATGWTVADVVKLHEIWTKYHLNDMNAGCVHQPHPDSGNCPHTGYKWGQRWLFKPLPYHVVAWISDKFEIEVPTPGVSTIERTVS